MLLFGLSHTSSKPINIRCQTTSPGPGWARVHLHIFQVTNCWSVQYTVEWQLIHSQAIFALTNIYNAAQNHNYCHKGNINSAMHNAKVPTLQCRTKSLH